MKNKNVKVIGIGSDSISINLKNNANSRRFNFRIVTNDSLHFPIRVSNDFLV